MTKRGQFKALPAAAGPPLTLWTPLTLLDATDAVGFPGGSGKAVRECGRRPAGNGKPAGAAVYDSASAQLGSMRASASAGTFSSGQRGAQVAGSRRHARESKSRQLMCDLHVNVHYDTIDVQC